MLHQKTLLPSNSNADSDLEYKRQGKFLNIKMLAADLMVENMSKKRKPLIKFRDPKHPDEYLICTGWDKIGMLADFLGIKRRELQDMVKTNNYEQVEELNGLLRSQGDRKIQINASEWQGSFWVFAFSTVKHQVITFSQIRKEVKEYLGKDVQEKEVNRMIVWEKEYNTFETEADKFDVKIVVTSGRNIKTSAIKVMTQMRVASCANSVICANFSSIKHTENWNTRLTNTLHSAVEIASIAQKVITVGAQKALTLEQGEMFIDSLKLSIKDEEKIARVRTALKNRLKHEFEQNQNMFALSQAHSYVGTYADPDRASERTLEILREKAYFVLAKSA